jgi:hypothetical protein
VEVAVAVAKMLTTATTKKTNGFATTADSNRRLWNL